MNLDNRQADAVFARIELDLRIGYIFTRLQSNALKPLGGPLKNTTLSYGNNIMPLRLYRLTRHFQALASFQHWVLWWTNILKSRILSRNLSGILKLRRNAKE